MTSDPLWFQAQLPGDDVSHDNTPSKELLSDLGPSIVTGIISGIAVAILREQL